MLASIILYGAPIWPKILADSKVLLGQVRYWQRTYALRIMRAYRKVSYDATCLLTRSPPVLLVALMRRRIFVGIKVLRQSGTWSEEER